MRVELLENKRENFKGLRLELDPDDKPVDLPRIFAVNSEGLWYDNSEYEDTPGVMESSVTPLSNEDAAEYLTDIAKDMPPYVSGGLKILLRNTQERSHDR